MDIPNSNMIVRNCIERCIIDNGWSNKEYATAIGLSPIKIMGIRKGVIMIDQLTVGELNRLVTFHKIHLEI